MINSTKLKTILTAIAILALGSFTYAQMTVGARVGPNFSNLRGESVTNNKGLVGYNFGGLFNYAMEDIITSSFGEMLSVQGELTLQTKGAKYESQWDNTGAVTVKQLNNTYVQVPILGMVTYPVNDKIEVYGEAGFFLSALFGVTVDGEKSRVIVDGIVSGEKISRKWREEYQGFDAGILIGAGGKMPIPNTKLKGFLNLRYSLGLKNIGDYNNKSPLPEESLSDIKTGAFSITIGVTYKLPAKKEQAYIPNENNDKTFVGVYDPNPETPEVVVKNCQKRFPKTDNIGWTKKKNSSDSIAYNYVGKFVYRDKPTTAEFLPTGEWQETKTTLKKNELYVQVLKYVDENYKDFTFKDAQKVTRADRKDYYYVHLEQLEKGQTRPYKYELFFNKAGKLEKINRPEEAKSQYLLTAEVPAIVGKKFKSRFSSAKDVTWQRVDTNWVSSFYYRDLPTTAEFTDSAQWVMTVVDLNIKKLYTPLKRNLDENYSDYRVTSAQKATRKDRNDYYLVNLVGKKKTVSPNKLELVFDKTGRLKEEK